MVLTITAEGIYAEKLTYLLHKHPDRLQSIDLPAGKAHIFYPEYSEKSTTAALLLDIDPIGMIRNVKHFTGKDFLLGQYVNDRPYTASSFMSTAIAKAFSSALNGNCKEYPELTDTPLPLTAVISVLPAAQSASSKNSGSLLINRLFEPLGYTVTAQQHILDEQFTGWGYSNYFTVTLKNTLPLKVLLSHLYVLIPVLDNEKHYFITQSEVDKLLQKGKGWLDIHSERDLIISRYLINVKPLIRSALGMLEADGQEGRLNSPYQTHGSSTNSPAVLSAQRKKWERLHDLRLRLVAETLKHIGAKSVIDLGCGDGKLIRLLLQEKQFERIAGSDVSYAELTACKNRLHWDDLPQMQRDRLTLFQSSLMYNDTRFYGFDAAAVVEVIEHLDENRLPAFEKSLFKYAKPKTVVLTTPNREYNVHYEYLDHSLFRHKDHRFEWDRHTFKQWAERIAAEYHYTVRFTPVGEEDKQTGAPCQMAVFTYGN